MSSQTGRDDPYSVLGISRDANSEQIKSAYRKLALRFHPDKASANEKDKSKEMFCKISNAYSVLSDDRRRAAYDRYGHAENIRSEQQQYEQQYTPFSGIFSGFRGHSFMNEDPFEVFGRVFAEEMRSSTSSRRANNDDDFFRDPFVYRSFGPGHDLFQGFFNQNDMRQGGGGGCRDQTQFYSSSSSTSYGGMRGGQSETVSTTTRVINGKRQTITERTITRPDGTIERHTDKSGDDDFPLLPNNGSNNGMARYLDSRDNQGRSN